MAVRTTRTLKTASYAEGRTFGGFGEFETIDFEIEYAVAPTHLANHSIVDIDKAPTDDQGRVRFKGNARLTYPRKQKPSALLVDVPNRGRPTAFSFNRPKPAELQNTNMPAGDGFLCRHGFAVLSVGWQFDAEGFSLEIPEAIENGAALRGEAICQMQPSRDTNSLLVGQGGVFTYEPTGTGRLYKRATTRDAYQEILTSKWQFGRIRDGTFKPSSRYISKEGGFTKGVIYTLVYETEGAPIVGLGLLALRDATTWFRHEFAWPLEAPDYAIAYGASQTGRILRHFLYENLNQDESNRQVFDLVLPHIAGGQRGDFNHRFAQPGSLGIPALGQRFPFALRDSHDIHSRRTEGLLQSNSNAPKIISTNTSWEYWRGDAALIHTHTDGESDIEPLENERIYMFAGTHHINGVVPPTKQLILTNEELPYVLNTISYTPLLRAALINGLRWLTDDIEPPPSRYPNFSDRTLVDRDEVLNRFATLPYFQALPDASSLPSLWFTDLGDHAEEGICAHPATLLASYPSGVSAVDESLNEVAGIRLPEIAVPIGIHSGWHPRHERHGATDQAVTFAGFSIFDIPQAIPSSRATCEKAVTQVADQLVAERYVLPEDQTLVIDNAMRRYDVAIETATAKPQE